MSEPEKTENTGLYLRLLGLAAVVAFAVMAGLWLGHWSVPEENPTFPRNAGEPAAVAQQGAAAQAVAPEDPSAPPLYFHARMDSMEDWNTVSQEAALAAEAGINRVIVPVTLAWTAGEPGEDVLAKLKRFVEVNPRAAFLLQVDMNPSAAWIEAHPSEAMVVDGAAQPLPSPASQQWLEDGRTALNTLLESVEGSEVSRRIMGYVICGLMEDRWLMPAAGDRSEVFRQGFRDWLMRRYPSEEALAEAWGRPGMKAGEVTLPEHPGAPDTGRVFVRLPEEQPLADLLRCVSEITGDALAAFVSHTAGTSVISPLLLAPYGHSLEPSPNMAGHFALGNLLESDLDGVLSPVSYTDRGLGGAGGYMGPVHSLLLRGKTWVVLDDTRTGMARDPETGAFTRMRGLRAEDIFDVQRRNFAAALVHGLGLAWSDPLAEGWLLDKEQWRVFAKMREIYTDHRPPPMTDPAAAAEGAGPGLVVVVDEASRFYQLCDTPLNTLLLAGGRDAALRAGLSVQFALLQDVLEGNIGPAPVWLFLNAFSLDGTARRQLRARFAQEQSCAVWLYAPGYFNGEASVENISDITGMRVRAFDGPAQGGSVFGLSGQYLPQDAPFGAAAQWNPLFYIEDEDADLLASYQASGRGSVAVKTMPEGWTSVFIAEPGVTPALLAEILRILEEPLYAPPGDANYFDALYAGGGLLSVHAGQAGKRAVSLGEYCDVQDLFDPAIGWVQKESFILPLRTGETRLFSVKPMARQAI
ncbi:MAG: hypothetical protein H3C30_08755 [Candidatus Hydrogenedentes bacterium]|nr:hypothetical protein [Candidatus Hydrogenedentota bacterium]